MKIKQEEILRKGIKTRRNTSTMDKNKKNERKPNKQQEKKIETQKKKFQKSAEKKGI